MLEEIQALMPILERISDGALWAFVVFMFVNMLDVLVWPIIFLSVVVVAGTTLTKVLRSTSEIGEIDFHRLTLSDSGLKCSYIGESKGLEEFFQWASKASGGSGKYLHHHDLEKIMETYNKNK